MTTLTKKQQLVFWLILLFQIIILLAFVFFRLIDYDEGSYLSAAYLVKEGKLPYIDFFYPQMPYLPYAYSLVSQCGFSSLFYGRLISVFAGIFLSIFVFWFIYKFSGDAKLSLFLFFIYGFNGLTINWHSVVKTLVLSDFFAFISFYFFASYLLSEEKNKNFKILLSGFFIGISFNFRLTFFLMFLVEGIMIFLLTSYQIIKKKTLDLVLLLSGAILSSPLAIYLFFKNSSAFVFGNIGYHLVWGLKVVKMALSIRIFTLCKFLFYPQHLFILIPAIISTIWLVQSLMKTKKLTPKDKVILFTSSLSLVIVAKCFLMSPTQFQYYEQAIPYILISSIPALSEFKTRWANKKTLISIISTFYLLFLVPFIAIFLFTFRERNKPFEIREVRKVTEVVEENSKPGETILSGWPAYAVFSNRKTVPGLETWGWETIPFLSLEQKNNFKLIDSLQVKEVILNKKINLLVEEEWFLFNFEDLIKSNYRLIETTQFTKIYIKKD